MKKQTKKSAKPAAEKHLSEKEVTQIDKLVREVVGKGRAIESVFKSSLKGDSRYVWFGVSDGSVLAVNPDKMSTRWLDPKSASVKKWQRMQQAALAREERAAKKADNAAAKKAAKAADKKAAAKNQLKKAA